jgi:N-acetylneuraminate synthase/N,N'-diacetyllegionaminate synthase
MGLHPIAIGESVIGESSPCFVIAEAGVNHNGDLTLAYQLVDAAARAGANAVKFQSFRADRLVISTAPKPAYQRTSDPNETQAHLLRGLELSFEQQRQIAAHCREVGIRFLSTPFDEESADFLEQVGVEAFKVASGELTNLPLLKHVAAKGRAMIVSTGMATLSDVQDAVDVVLGAGNDDIVLLHCLSAYPAPISDVNLRAMSTMSKEFDLFVGYSDHTIGTAVALAAVALGARVLEKHLTIDRSLPGPDHATSAEPTEFAAMVRAIREVEVALGDGEKRCMPSEQELAKLARRSIYAKTAISAGSTILPHMLTVRRPALGLAPAMWDQIVGRKVTKDIPAEAPITVDALA